MIIAIVTADRNWAIGKLGRQVTTIPDDVRYIRQVTTGNIAVMGRKTFESYPTAQIPVNRTNIVLTKNPDYKALGGAIVCTDISQVIEKAKELKQDVYVLGGGSVFEQMLPYFDVVEVTAVDYSYDADRYFPNLDKLPEWVMIEESEEQTHFDTVYYLRRYARRKDYQA